ncbi:hypothetical protein GTQ40_00955 [Flavobacteriaceae bacterium R38]|nr:hypothetical protein [Flavobacteriaceae bacterium R38]
MKKTVFILTFAFVAFISNVNASDITTFTPNSNTTDTEISSNFSINSFFMAVAKGDINTVKKLIEFGENVNQKTTSGMTPAMYAARYNRVEILELLIEHGADLKAKCKLGYKAAHYAKASDSKEAMRVIKNALNS